MGWPISPVRAVADRICVKPTPKAISAENGIIPAKRPGPNMSNRDVIRASEIGDWCFCRRAWYLTNRKTQPSLLQIERRQAGTAYHERHGRAIIQPRREINAEKLVLLLLVLLVVACWLISRAG